ncbi:ferric-dicitrate binding protein FerR (iron transport regulator) [Mucilaginibacter rubeus]|uniref:FecR family protein n=1 Tax=Mucilaginibacter rubeus TaxID=2027860 RepID=UPI0033955BA7
MEKKDLEKLFIKYHEGKCTEDEKALLEAWYLDFNEQDLDISPKKIRGIGEQIFRELPGNHTAFLKIGVKLAIAAGSIGMMITIGVKFIMPKTIPGKTAAIHDIKPGGNNATLTLANGQKINLSAATNGQIAKQGSIQIFKTASGQISYRSIALSSAADVGTTNNISTPKGGQWAITLPDGSRVLLNSASSFSFPTSFKNQNERIVQLKGEGYFEVAKDKAHAFIVKTDQQSVKVLGTHFNINSYPDEPAIKTTLAVGSVQVFAVNGRSILLSPGQQSILKEGNLTRQLINVNDELVWTRGAFHFSDQSIQSIMRQIARWYDIDVHYEADVTHEGLNGRISRYKNLSQVLSALEATQSVHFKVEGRRITVMK